MVILNAFTVDTPIIKYLVIAFLLTLVIWRISVLFKPKGKSKDRKTPYEPSDPNRAFFRDKKINWVVSNKNDSPVYGLMFSAPIEHPKPFIIISLIPVLAIGIGIGIYIHPLWGVVGLAVGILAVFEKGIALYVKSKREKDFKHIIQGFYEYKWKNTEKAIEEYKKAIAIEPKEFTYFLLAQAIQREIGQDKASAEGEGYDYSEAIAALDNAISLDSNVWESYKYRGELNLLQSNFQAALNDFERANHLSKDAVRPEQFAELYKKWGKALFYAGKHNEALDKMNIAIELNQNDKYYLHWLYDRRAEINFYLGNYEASINDYWSMVKTAFKNRKTIGAKDNELWNHKLARIISPVIQKVEPAFKALSDRSGYAELCKKVSQKFNNPVGLKAEIIDHLLKVGGISLVILFDEDYEHQFSKEALAQEHREVEENQISGAKYKFVPQFNGETADSYIEWLLYIHDYEEAQKVINEAPKVYLYNSTDRTSAEIATAKWDFPTAISIYDELNGLPDDWVSTIHIEIIDILFKWGKLNEASDSLEVFFMQLKEKYSDQPLVEFACDSFNKPKKLAELATNLGFYEEAIILWETIEGDSKDGIFSDTSDVKYRKYLREKIGVG